MRSALAVTVVGALAVFGLSACGGGDSHKGSAATSSSSTSVAAVDSGSGTDGALAFQQALVGVISRVRPAVVEIHTTTDLGSGILFDTKGDIVTNYHVVGSATTFSVKFANGATEQGALLGAYPPDDLAVIHVKPPSGVSPAKFGNSQSMQVGDVVVAIGNPLGLASSVTEGIVSYNGRTVAEPNNVVLPATIQTSAPINPGNSGGALVDLAGDVVGIPTLAATDQQIGGGAAPGIGFAIPSDIVKSIADQIVATGKVTNSGRAALGISAADAVNQSGRPAGVAVISLTPGGAAAKAGIPTGSVITAINGEATPNVAKLAAILAGLNPGAAAKVSYVAPGGSAKTVTVSLGELGGSS